MAWDDAAVNAHRQGRTSVGDNIHCAVNFSQVYMTS